MRLPLPLLVFVVLAAAPARAQEFTDAQSYFLSSATTFSPLTTTGVVVLIVVLSRDKPEAEELADAAHLYLRQNALQLAQDLAVGEGPVIEELAAALRLRPQNVAVFREALRRDRRALMDLADPDRLDRPRAVAFARRLQALLAADPGLKQDLDRLAAAY